MVADRRLITFPDSSKRTPLRESAVAVSAYNNYEALGDDRSLPKLVIWYQRRAKSNQEEGLSGDTYVPALSTLKRWSERHNWQLRLKAYEDKQLEARRKKRQDDLDRMDEEHSLVGRALLLRTVDVLKSRLEAGEIGTYGLVQLFEKAANLERIARGAVTSRVEGDVTLLLAKEYINVAPGEEGSEP